MLIKGRSLLLVLITAALFVTLNPGLAVAEPGQTKVTASVSQDDVLKASGVNPSTGETAESKIKREARERGDTNMPPPGTPSLDINEELDRINKQRGGTPAPEAGSEQKPAATAASGKAEKVPPKEEKKPTKTSAGSADDDWLPFALGAGGLLAIGGLLAHRRRR
jgi:MYXO-CTERM domain-containing protein